MVRWLPESAIHAIHGELMVEHGGLAGPANRGMLEATLARPQHLASDNNGSPSPFQLAAPYGFGFARNHCFNDGNKRITLASIDVFLIMNSYELIAEEADAVITIDAWPLVISLRRNCPHGSKTTHNHLKANKQNFR